MLELGLSTCQGFPSLRCCLDGNIVNFREVQFYVNYIILFDMINYLLIN